VAVDKDGNIYWNDRRYQQSGPLTKIKERPSSSRSRRCTIRADKDAKFESVGRVLYAIQRGGVVKVGFLTEPDMAWVGNVSRRAGVINYGNECWHAGGGVMCDINTTPLIDVMLVLLVT